MNHLITYLFIEPDDRVQTHIFLFNDDLLWICNQVAFGKADHRIQSRILRMNKKFVQQKQVQRRLLAGEDENYQIHVGDRRPDQFACPGQNIVHHPFSVLRHAVDYTVADQRESSFFFKIPRPLHWTEPEASPSGCT